MRTEQATLVLASLMRPRRMFQSYDLGAAAKKLVIEVQKALETFEAEANAGRHAAALEKVNESYRLLGATPPAADADSLAARRHPLLESADRPAGGGEEAEAWRALLSQVEDR